MELLTAYFDYCLLPETNDLSTFTCSKCSNNFAIVRNR